MSWSNYLHTIWYDTNHPASYSGPDKLYRIVKNQGHFKIGRRRIKQWLQDQDSYGLSRNVIRKFPRNRYVVNTIDSLWEIDLADVSNIKALNDNYKYLLFVIDVFSRFLWIQPLKDKTGKNVVSALNRILSTGRKPKSIRSDKGSEFKNKEVKTLLSQQGISTYYSQNETKCAVLERVIRTIKSVLYRYFRHSQTYKYIDLLQKFVHDYNHRPHRSLGQIKPADVNTENADEVRVSAYLTKKAQRHETAKKVKGMKKKRSFKFKVGDLVRITYIRHPFQRDYQQKWTEELFRIRRRYLRQGISVYQLKDFSDESIDGTFYQPELQKMN